MISKIEKFISDHQNAINDVIEGSVYGGIGSVFLQSMDKEIVHLLWVMVSAILGAIVVYFTKKWLRKLFPDNN